MVWCSHLFQNFPHFAVIHRAKGFGFINKAEVDVFLELSCSFDAGLCFAIDTSHKEHMCPGASETTLTSGDSLTLSPSASKLLNRALDLQFPAHNVSKDPPPATSPGRHWGCAL